MNYNYKHLPLNKNRDELIRSICKNKKILHIGATDAPYTQEKFENGLLLHKTLMECSEKVMGIDIDSSSIDFLKSKGINNINLFDMNKLGELPFSPDIIIFGEIIEHLQNFQTALDNIKSIMTPETELLISTPNRFYLLSFFIAILQQREPIHSDHKVVFSYGSLRQLLEANGLKITHFHFTFLPREKESLFKKTIRLFCKFRPCAAETLLATVKINTKPSTH